MRYDSHPALAFGGVQGKIRFAQDIIKGFHRFVVCRYSNADSDWDGKTGILKISLAQPGEDAFEPFFCCLHIRIWKKEYEFIAAVSRKDIHMAQP